MNITNQVYVFQDEMFPIVFQHTDIEIYWEMMGLYVFIIQALIFFI